MKFKLFSVFLTSLWIFVFGICAFASERQYLWAPGKMPHIESHQIAALYDEICKDDFVRNDHQIPYIEWMDSPNPVVANGACIVLISGGGYYHCCDIALLDLWNREFTKLGFQCVTLVYRTPRSIGRPIYQSAWEDGQRAIKMIRNQAKARGFDPEKIGTISMSAGSHLAMLLACSSLTPAHSPIDEIDSIPCHINFAIANAPAYVTTDSKEGTPSWQQGYGCGVRLDDCFKFDQKTCPVSLHHGGADEYSPNGSTLIYRELHKRNIPAELHLYADQGHGAYGLERGIEFLYQIGILGNGEEGADIMSRYDDNSRESLIKQDIWNPNTSPNFQDHQIIPYIEWHFPKNKKTDAIQIMFSGGSYEGNDPNIFEVAPARRALNDLGMTVVTLKYRTPRPQGLPKHITAWQDLQRAIRLVRAQAPQYGLDPNQIGLMGSSAGGHLALMGATSARHNCYLPTDSLDLLPCNVQWCVAVYPAYVLSDGADNENTTRGDGDGVSIVPDFSFDLDTPPMLFIHGSADVYSSMGSVMVWEKLRSMGIQSELHTYALRNHNFQLHPIKYSGSYTWVDRIIDFLKSQNKL